MDSFWFSQDGLKSLQLVVPYSFIDTKAKFPVKRVRAVPLVPTLPPRERQGKEEGHGLEIVMYKTDLQKSGDVGNSFPTLGGSLQITVRFTLSILEPQMK